MLVLLITKHAIYARWQRDSEHIPFRAGIQEQMELMSKTGCNLPLSVLLTLLVVAVTENMELHMVLGSIPAAKRHSLMTLFAKA